MLVLSRKVGEEIVIDNNIRVVVLEVLGNRVRLGVVAPEDVAVDRHEVFARRMQFVEVPVKDPSNLAKE
jgi:carbon storage regulator